MDDDYISRQDAVGALANYIMNVDKVYSTGKLTQDDCIDCAKSVLDDLSSADVVRVVHGHWIPYRCDMYECSVCQRIHTSMDVEGCDAEYCPNCGAKMDAQKEEQNV